MYYIVSWQPGQIPGLALNLILNFCYFRIHTFSRFGFVTVSGVCTAGGMLILSQRTQVQF